MRYFLDISRTGLVAVLLHPLRSAVCVVALVVVLLPYLVGLALARGIEEEAEEAVQFGADLYVTGLAFGRSAPLSVPEATEWLEHVPGVEKVVPRIVGAATLGREHVPCVLIGLPPEHFPEWARCVDGDLPRQGSAHDLVIGSALARKLKLEVGSVLPPFYRNDRQGERLSRVVGIFRPDAPLWQAHLVLTTFESAAVVFDEPGLATDLLVWCRSGYQAEVTRAVERGLPRGPGRRGAVPLRVTTREDLQALLPQGLLHREGVFNLLFLLAFVVAILVLLVTSGLGLAERRREIGILKATGWQTDEVLLRGLVESLALSLSAACVSLLLAWLWLRVFNAWGIAGVFLAGVGVAPEFRVAYRLTPIPFLLAFILSLVVVLTGTLYSSWRAATTPPREAMR